MSLPKDVSALAGLFAVSGVIALVNPTSREYTLSERTHMPVVSMGQRNTS